MAMLELIVFGIIAILFLIGLTIMFFISEDDLVTLVAGLLFGGILTILFIGRFAQFV